MTHSMTAELTADAPPAASRRRAARRARLRRPLLLALTVLVVVALAASAVVWYRSRAVTSSTATSAASVHARLATARPIACDATQSGARPTGVCFGSQLVARSDGMVELLGFFGLGNGRGIDGVAINLIVPVAGGGQVATGSATVTDSQGHFAFIVPAVAGARHYGFRFAGSRYYPKVASRMITVIGE